MPDIARWFTGISGDDMRAVAVACAPDPEQVGLLLSCAVNAHQMWDGGNQWSRYPAFLSFFRHVVQLPLDYSRWQHYEAAACHAGPRIMHQDFCIISDRPVVLTVDAQHRPHSADGPFCAWRDGTALWAWHGVYVPAWIIAHPARITIDHIQHEPNAEIRRVLLERYGYERFIADTGAEAIHTDDVGTLYRTAFPDDEPVVCVRVRNSTLEPDGSATHYMIRVDPAITTARAAVAWSFGLSADEYQPTQET